MTDIQKAIKFAKNEIKSLELAPKINGCEMTEWWKEQIWIWETAISTLEKQIPKKPIWDMGWVCPNCKNYEIQHFEKRPDWDDLFCCKCRQALDWSDT